MLIMNGEEAAPVADAKGSSSMNQLDLRQGGACDGGNSTRSMKLWQLIEAARFTSERQVGLGLRPWRSLTETKRGPARRAPPDHP